MVFWDRIISSAWLGADDPCWGRSLLADPLAAGVNQSRGSGPGVSKCPAQHNPCRPPVPPGGSSVTPGRPLTSLRSHFLIRVKGVQVLASYGED